MTKVKNKMKLSIADIKKPKFITAVFIVAILTVVGVHVLFKGLAAGPSVAIDAANGVLSGGAVVQNDASLSNGKYVQFASGSSSGTYHTTGNQIIGPKGVFQPFGFVVYCLSQTTGGPGCTGPFSDTDKIKAASTYWHANDIRIQAADELLYPGGGTTVDQSYVAELDAEVNLANSLGMVAVVTQQTERSSKTLAPDATSTQFWNYISAHYANNSKVFFDLFNEPRLKIADISGGTETSMWDIWQNGGTVNLTAGGSGTFVGMQSLIGTVRSHANNIIVAEVTDGNKDTKLLTTHLLKDSNLVYGYEPNFYAPGSYGQQISTAGRTDTPAAWDVNFGNLSNTYPMMMEAFNDHPSGGCYPASNVLFPQFLT